MSTGLNVKPFCKEYVPLVENFSSGNMIMDGFLKSPSALDPNYGKTYVLLSDDESLMLGYFNIITGSLDYSNNGIREKMGGAIHINQFALDVKYHGLVQAETEDGDKINLSDFFLGDCIGIIREIRDRCVGFSFITLCATSEGLGLYKRFGFNELEEDMFLSKEDGEFKCTSMYCAIDLE